MKIYTKPKLKLPILKYFKFEKFWQKQKFSQKEKENIVNLAKEIDKILKNIPESNRNQLVSPPKNTFDPSVTQKEWNDFLGVVFGAKPASIIGMNYKGQTYNPIAEFAKLHKNIFKNLFFANYWDFAFTKDFRNMKYEFYKDGFIYNKNRLIKLIKKYPALFKNWNWENVSQTLKMMIEESNTNRPNFHQKLGILMGYSPKRIKEFIRNEQKYYH